MEERNENIIIATIVSGVSIIGLIIILIILSRIRKGQIELQTALSDADRANRAKSDFLSTMSHELRTPLNAIIGFSDMIKYQIHGPVSPSKYQDYADDINESGNHLLALINQVLDMSKIEAGKHTVFIEDFRLSDVIKEVLAMIKIRANSQQISIATEFPSESLEVKADRMITKQILVNLLTNAVKFSSAGGSVTVRVLMSGREVVVNVIDTGIGMSREEQKRSLEPFVQIEREKGRSHEGTGLGLSLCNHFAELQGGKFTIHSEKGKGTVASFSLVPTDIESLEITETPKTESGKIGPWLPSMSIGIEKWDADHIALLGLIEELQGAIENGEPLEVKGYILNTLVPYIDIHLASEEFVMKRMNYPDYTAHLAKHDEFRHWMETILASPLETTDDWRSNVVANALLDWWYSHILKDDMAYTAFFYPRRKEVADLLADYKGVKASQPQ
ncbi:MAG: hypothetical protein HOC63_02125 [Rhodospirillales bacterium]|jgi:hemerythrin-like metal-binding protein|nr:hypothetical protein [Rhodospirillales bacterium]MBT4625461.1 hypothetical protein [Rhodospirillales bacterium]MBT5352099.1 hypothetical protein [Rhodospirillales bacterium]MBT5521868.1 hypothetical protein [Rhodospirillales bacterium]MBT6109811.1 hypothetical protein [Rhodospirillales bacterium]